MSSVDRVQWLRDPSVRAFLRGAVAGLSIAAVLAYCFGYWVIGRL